MLRKVPLVRRHAAQLRCGGPLSVRYFRELLAAVLNESGGCQCSGTERRKGPSCPCPNRGTTDAIDEVFASNSLTSCVSRTARVLSFSPRQTWAIVASARKPSQIVLYSVPIFRRTHPALTGRSDDDLQRSSLTALDGDKHRSFPQCSAPSVASHCHYECYGLHQASS
ncbi:hypothetical protein K466DRAFT_122882 [Polyporus arcularius HHB13444]|uniref:Uncharacterized protein n=1 Tax=Polyporus arcularius HHB13444 TaxID=1314778 RepID=A0A5C3PBW5_9APHY|nr:hypothetical protein K466DRAFT_122882 [Polyporus arcularius HHB13444]